MRLLAYDTETSGLPLWNEPSESPTQPHIVQVGAMLVDTEKRKVLHAIDLIIRPDGWTIPADVAEIHGITTEFASDVGVSEKLAVDMVLDMWDTAEGRLGHNEGFDARIMRIALMRHANATLADEWKAAKAECTQLLATPILKLPPTDKMKKAGFNKYKSANLREAYTFFTGRELVDAHSAMADCRACLDVYYAIKDGRTTPAPRV